MKLRNLILGSLLVGALPSLALAQTAQDPSTGLLVELNTTQDVNGSCQLTFLVQNQTGVSIESAHFEFVFFDAEGSLLNLAVYDFSDLPAGRPRVRQYSLADRSCSSIGRVLINGANKCTVDSADSALCQQALTPSSRVELELLG